VAISYSLPTDAVRYWPLLPTDLAEDDEGGGMGVPELLVVQVCGVRSESEEATQTSYVLPLDLGSYELPLDPLGV
jgi:hypothetical protein